MANELRDFNPAARLYRVLLKASQTRVAVVRQAWAAAFAIQENDYAGIQWRLVDLHRLVLDIETRIETAPEEYGKRELYLRPFPNVKKILTYGNLDAAWDTVKEWLDGSTLARVEFCEDLLSRLSPEREIPPSELADLRKDVEGLLGEALKSPLPPDLKAFIVAELRRIQLAIDTYEIHGASGLRDALKHVVGAGVLGRAGLKGPEGAKELTRFAGILVTVEKLTATAAHLQQLAGGAALLLKYLGAGN
ncbi:MAG: hypothetical protein EPN53_14305 [Acidobacteria bacterium]|nr:MAG: hypothetical protein EPN53_14305 [Acidobacteriota bacterium]